MWRNGKIMTRRVANVHPLFREEGKESMQDTEPKSKELAASERVGYGRLPGAALLAALAAAVINAAIYFAASGVGFVSQNVLVPTPGGEQSLTASLVVISSIAGAIGATVVFALIVALAWRPVRLFRIVATVVLLLSLAMPLTIPGAPLSMVLSLEVMHVAAWAVIVGLLTTLARREAVS